MERVFSQVNLVKTEMTNRLKSQSVANRVIAKQAILRKSKACYLWSPSKSLIDDVVQGRCHQRYVEHRNSMVQANAITTHDLSDDDNDN